MNVNRAARQAQVDVVSVPVITITSRGASTTQAIEMNAAVGDALVDKVEGDQEAELATTSRSSTARSATAGDRRRHRGTEKAIQANVLGTLLQQRSNLQTEDQDKLEVLGEPFAGASRSARSRPGTPPWPSCWP